MEVFKEFEKWLEENKKLVWQDVPVRNMLREAYQAGFELGLEEGGKVGVWVESTSHFDLGVQYREKTMCPKNFEERLSYASATLNFLFRGGHYWQYEINVKKIAFYRVDLPRRIFYFYLDSFIGRMIRSPKTVADLIMEKSSTATHDGYYTIPITPT